MVTRCSGGSNTALLRFIYRITTALLLAGIYAHALPSNDVIPDVLPKVLNSLAPLFGYILLQDGNESTPATRCFAWTCLAALRGLASPRGLTLV